MKNIQQSRVQKEQRIDLETKVREKWPEILDINFDLTAQLNSSGMNYKNQLDASSTKEHSFRIKTISGLIPSLSKLAKFREKKNPIIPTCPRCKLETETADHIWKCPETAKLIPIIQFEAIKELKYKLKNVYTYRKIKNKEPPTNLKSSLVS